MNLKTISITVNNIEVERGGQLIVFVFFEEGFPKLHDKALEKFILSVNNETIQVDIQVPSNQEFALKILHDENMDEKVTKNWTGIIPKDEMGFSNGARIFFGPPSFKKAKIQFLETMLPVITMKYF